MELFAALEKIYDPVENKQIEFPSADYMAVGEMTSNIYQTLIYKPVNQHEEEEKEASKIVPAAESWYKNWSILNKEEDKVEQPA